MTSLFRIISKFRSKYLSTFFILLFFVYYVTMDRLFENNKTQKSLVPVFAMTRTTPKSKKCSLKLSSGLGGNPMFKVNKDKFLFPVLYNGPTNQMIGMRDSVFLSIILNRTLIIPRFRKHYVDLTGPNEIVDPLLRFDVTDMSSLVTPLPHSALWEKCGNHMDVAFRGKPQERFKLTEEGLKYGNVTMKKNKKGDYDVKPAADGSIKSANHLQKHFASDGRCAMLFMVYRSVVTMERVNHIKAAIKIAKTRDVRLNEINLNQLYGLIYLKVRKPNFILQIARDFIGKVISSKYLAIHWRFDPKDWLRKCFNNEGNKKMCGKIYNVTGMDIVTSAVNKANEFHLQPTLYFATPLDQEKVMMEVKVAVEKLNKKRGNKKIRLLTFSDIRKFLERYKSCHWIEGYEDDLLASVEMQICASSTIFFSSFRSTWSGEVKTQREILDLNKNDEDVLEQALKLKSV